MNLRDELDRIADDAPPLGHDAADRALRNARRHRRRVQLPIAGAVVALALAVIGTAVVRPALIGLDFGPAETWKERTEIPATAEPLPAKGVRPARMAYLWTCSVNLLERKHCVEARVMTQDNRHWVVPEARPRKPTRESPYDPAIVLSPDGEKLVYTDGPRFVLRELMSGKVTELVTIPTDDAIFFGDMAWAPDSRWLVLYFGGGEDQRSTLIDVTTQRVIPLEGWPVGLPNGADVMAFTDAGRMDEGMVLHLRDRSGASKGTIPTSVLGAPGPFTPEGMMSPDGDLAALEYRPGPHNPPRITVVGIEPTRAIDQINFDTRAALPHPYVLGWLDDSRFLYVAHWMEEAWVLPTRHTLQVYDAAGATTRPLTELVGNPQPGTVSVATDLL